MSGNHQIIKKNTPIIGMGIYAKNPIKQGFIAVFLCIIKGYQMTLSPDHGWGRILFPSAGCRFYPSCSEYTKQSLERHGISRGLWLGLKRLGRCHPFSDGGLDPIKQ